MQLYALPGQPLVCTPHDATVLRHTPPGRLLGLPSSPTTGRVASLSFPRCISQWHRLVTNGSRFWQRAHAICGVSASRHSALGTRHSALGTRHSALGTRHSALGTRHLASRHSALGISSPARLHPAPSLARTLTSPPQCIASSQATLAPPAPRYACPPAAVTSPLATSLPPTRVTPLQVATFHAILAPVLLAGHRPSHTSPPHRLRRDWPTLAILRRLHRPSHRRLQRRCVRSSRSPQPQHPQLARSKNNIARAHFARMLLADSSTSTITAPIASTAPVCSSHGTPSRSRFSLNNLVCFPRTSVSV
jgi:hypothetical protein